MSELQANSLLVAAGVIMVSYFIFYNLVFKYSGQVRYWLRVRLREVRWLVVRFHKWVFRDYEPDAPVPAPTRRGAPPAPQQEIIPANKPAPSAPVLDRDGRWPAEVWIPAIFKNMSTDKLPHIMIVGESRDGKSTAARALMSYASHMGAKLVIMDPHTKEGDYPIEVIGRYRNFEAINTVLSQLLAEFNWRFSQDHHDHEPILMFIDEWLSIAKYCPLASEFLEIMLSEAGKVHLHLIILTTSPLVDDLKINSAYRRNFSRLLVGTYAKQFMPAAFKAAERYVTALDYKGAKMALGSLQTKELSLIPVAPGCLWKPRTGALPLRTPSSSPASSDQGEADPPAGTEQVVKVTLWLQENPNISAREVARRLYGNDNGRYAMRAGAILKQVRSVTDGVTEGVTDPVTGVTFRGVTGQ